MCACVCVYARAGERAFQNPVRLITSPAMVGFKNNLAQKLIIITSKCVANKNHIARSEVKVTVRTQTLCTCFSETCSRTAHNFVLHGENRKIFDTNNYHDKAVCRVQYHVTS